MFTVLTLFCLSELAARDLNERKQFATELEKLELYNFNTFPF